MPHTEAIEYSSPMEIDDDKTPYLYNNTSVYTIPFGITPTGIHIPPCYTDQYPQHYPVLLMIPILQTPTLSDTPQRFVPSLF